MKTLSERLRHALTLRKSTQVALADACGVTKGAVNQWLSGAVKSLDGANLLSAAQFLKVSARWLQTGHGPMRDAAISPESHGLPHPLDEPKPPTISDEVWQSLPPKARALVEDIVRKSHEGKIKEEDLVLLLSTADRLSQSDP